MKAEGMKPASTKINLHSSKVLPSGAFKSNLTDNYVSYKASRPLCAYQTDLHSHSATSPFSYQLPATFGQVRQRISQSICRLLFLFLYPLLVKQKY